MVRQFGWGSLAGTSLPGVASLSVVALAACIALAGCKGGKDAAGDDDDDTVTDPWADLDLDLITTVDRPYKRSEIKSVGNEATNSILLFGGNAGPVVNQVITSDFRNDTWIFQPGTGWSEVQSEETPRKRGRYAMAVDEPGHRALMFGGRWRELDGSGDYTLFDDLWEFDFDARQWTRLHDGSGRGPSARYYPEAVYDPEAGLFYVWGGATNANPLNVEIAQDVWAWDGESWSELQTTGDAPSRRTFVGTMYDPVRNRLIVFGGQSGDFVSCAYNDLYALELDTLEWRKLHGGQGRAPETRFHSHLVYDADADRYLMFGGHADIGAMNDLWAFDPEGETWSKVHIADILEADPYAACDNLVSPGCNGNPSEVPKEFALEDPTAPERRYRGMFVEMHGNLWLGSGINIECSDHIDDTWRYDIANDTWTELVEARAGESCIRRGDDCACMCI